MKVLLINPPYTRISGSGQGAYFPLGLGYLAGTLANEGFEPMIYNAENCRPGEPLPKTAMREVFCLRSEAHRQLIRALRDDQHPVWQETRRVLEKVRPDLVGITALSVQFGAAAKMAEMVKYWREECPVVLGGHHVTYLPGDTFRQAPQFDVAVIGEGEATFLELCQAYRQGGVPDFSRIPGLAYLSGDSICFSDQRPLMEDLDAVPHPRRDLAVFSEGYAPMHFSSLILGRGCPWRCRFCSSQVFWNRRTRMRSPENCLQEIEALMTHAHVNHFVFWDDAFTVNRKVILAFCGQAQESGLAFTFHTATRADLVDQEIISALREAGCVKLTLGVETGSPRISRMIKKDLDLDALRQAAVAIRRNGIALGTFFMAGFPRETREDLQMTWDLIKEIKAHEVAFNIFDPMPGSELYDECIELGLIPEDVNWLNFPLWPDRHFVTAMGHEEFDALAREMAEYLFRRNEGLLGRVRQNLPLLRRHPKIFLGKVSRRLMGALRQ